MKSLIIEDDYITSQVMQEILLAFGEADVAENGFKGLELFTTALVDSKKYDVIFLDIMMPELDGQQVLAQIRRIEEDYEIFGLDGVKIIMTTALDDFDNIKTAFKNQCEGYIVKPIDKDKIIEKVVNLGLA
ncbi:MAG TPA: response regulator [Candidatus Kapabacteria bacterium]|nr:response regulator [Candidatus Kapabacteria bacterium]